jgi:hypothetical protein
MLRKGFFSVSVIVVGVMFLLRSFVVTSSFDAAAIWPDSTMPSGVLPDH